MNAVTPKPNLFTLRHHQSSAGRFNKWNVWTVWKWKTKTSFHFVKKIEPLLTPTWSLSLFYTLIGVIEIGRSSTVIVSNALSAFTKSEPVNARACFFTTTQRDEGWDKDIYWHLKWYPIEHLVRNKPINNGQLWINGMNILFLIIITDFRGRHFNVIFLAKIYIFHIVENRW